MTTAPETRWLSLAEIADLLSIGIGKVRRLIEDHSLLAAKVDGVWKVPETFLRDGEPLVELRGTVLVLQDSGFSDDEAMRWLLSEEASLGVAPIDALRAGRKAEVRRVAQALGF